VKGNLINDQELRNVRTWKLEKIGHFLQKGNKLLSLERRKIMEFSEQKNDTSLCPEKQRRWVLIVG
jgi:hypothetical protein